MRTRNNLSRISKAAFEDFDAGEPQSLYNVLPAVALG